MSTTEEMNLDPKFDGVINSPEEINGEYLSEVDIPIQKRNGYDTDFVDELLDRTARAIHLRDVHIGELTVSATLEAATGKNPQPTNFAADNSEKLTEGDNHMEVEENHNEIDPVNDFAVREQGYKNTIQYSDERIASLEEEKSRLESENEELRNLLEQYAARIEELEAEEPVEVTDEEVHALTSTQDKDVTNSVALLQLAEKVANEARIEAEREAAETVRKANEEAAMIKNNSEIELTNIKNEITRLKDRKASFLGALKHQANTILSEVSVFEGETTHLDNY